MAISMEDVKILREKTGISLAECRKALEEGGSLEAAMEVLKERSAAMAEKKSDRELSNHAVAAYIHPTGGMGVLVDIMCETDFVSQNEEVKQLARDVAMQIASMRPEFLRKEDAPEGTENDMILMEQTFVKDPSLSMKELIAQKIQKFGENIVIAHMTRFGN